MTPIHKSLLIPVNSKGQILLQDRSGHLPPPWGFFGGAIEEGETPLQAVIRETEEELSVNIQENELNYLGKFEFTEKNSQKQQISHVYIWKTELTTEDFVLREGAGMKFVDLTEAKELLSFGGDLEILQVLS